MMKMNRVVALLTTTMMVGFENKAGWKKDESGALVLNDSGDPVFVDGEGKELVVRGNTIPQMLGENRNFRERLQAAETNLKKFEGLDPEAARAAVDKLAGVDLDKMVESGKLEEVRQSITQQFQGRLTDAEKRAQELQSRLDDQIRSTAFSQSEFVRDRVAIPPTLFQKEFGDRFKVEDGKLVPYDSDGNVLYSSKNMASVASFDEALSMMVDSYQYKDSILKPMGHEGSGNSGQGGNRSQSGRRITRAEFDGMNPAQQAAAAKAQRAGEMTIVD